MANRATEHFNSESGSARDGSSPAVGHGELQRRKTRVQRIVAHQRVVRSQRDDAAALHHRDAVGVAHRREAVRDDQHRAARHQPLERALHDPLAFGIERARRFVEQQDRAIGEDRARDREPLPLPAGKPHAALAEQARRSRRAGAR